MSQLTIEPELLKSDRRWVKICHKDELVPNLGVTALINQQQIALYYLPNHEQTAYAIDNWDPIAKAYVMSRGIIGDQDGVLCIASPLLKQHFALATGQCIENPTFALRVWDTCWHNDELWINIEH
ncbi:nitrite reductase small subunit NirD [Photobacterium leiognathi]|uniref:nitrite reductase small subunit NirD n=1 Tax=Photobacterium leiognathi TaxID=553611 RepID=UPI002734FCDE|nr:nitrite reductase small subunit NirD [Photobacterium leiognathi]